MRIYLEVISSHGVFRNLKYSSLFLCTQIQLNAGMNVRVFVCLYISVFLCVRSISRALIQIQPLINRFASHDHDRNFHICHAGPQFHSHKVCTNICYQRPVQSVLIAPSLQIKLNKKKKKNCHVCKLNLVFAQLKLTCQKFDGKSRIYV